MKSKIWSLLLFILIPLGEFKAIFYTSDLKVNWYLLTDNKRYIDNVLEDYGNALTLIIIFAYVIFAKKSNFDLNVCKLYFIISVLDLLHLGAYDMQGLIYLKFITGLIIWSVWTQKRLFIKLWFYLWQQR